MDTVKKNMWSIVCGVVACSRSLHLLSAERKLVELNDS